MHTQDFTLTFDSENDPVFPAMPDAGEDLDFTNHNAPHVYRVEAYVHTERRRPRRDHDPRDIEVVSVFRLDDGGTESEVPYRVWREGEAGLADAIVKDLADQYDGWDRGDVDNDGAWENEEADAAAGPPAPAPLLPIVTLSDDDDKPVTYQIVGQTEADARTGRISYNSPLGRALIGRQVDDEIEVSVPAGDRYYVVKKIEFI